MQFASKMVDLHTHTYTQPRPSHLTTPGPNWTVHTETVVLSKQSGSSFSPPASHTVGERLEALFIQFEPALSSSTPGCEKTTSSYFSKRLLWQSITRPFPPWLAKSPPSPSKNCLAVVINHSLPAPPQPPTSCLLQGGPSEINPPQPTAPTHLNLKLPPGWGWSRPARWPLPPTPTPSLAS